MSNSHLPTALGLVTAGQQVQLKPGDVVRIVHGDPPFFQAGTRATLTEFDGEHWWADFSDEGNPDGSFDPDCDATWCIGVAGKDFNREQFA